MSRTSRRLALALPVLLLAALGPGCGKKGPPVEPTLVKPGRVREFTARRYGDTVYVRLTIPAADPGGGPVAELTRIEVFAYTARAATDLDDPKLATKVATVQVQRIVTPEQEEAWKKRGVPPPDNPGSPVGSVVVLTERLTPEMHTPIEPRRRRAVPLVPEPDVTLALPLTSPVAEPKPRRFYLARAIGRKDLQGPDSATVAVPLHQTPPPPESVKATPTAASIDLAWSPPSAQRAPIQEPAAGDTLKATSKGMPPRVVYSYHVYPATGPAPGPAGADEPPQVPTPLTARPLTETAYSDKSVEFGVERCYVVRSVETAESLSWESDPSAPACVTSVDQYPPPVPTSLAAVASAGAISLIWDGVQAPDLAGYLVMRSEGGAPLAPLFDTPIRETTYRDATAKPGVRYTYAVVSVDTATPANVSAPSNRVEESAR